MSKLKSKSKRVEDESVPQGGKIHQTESESDNNSPVEEYKEVPFSLGGDVHHNGAKGDKMGNYPQRDDQEDHSEYRQDKAEFTKGERIAKSKKKTTQQHKQ